jgi:hypothetical protein
LLVADYAKACEGGEGIANCIKNIRRPNVVKKYTFGRFALQCKF